MFFELFESSYAASTHRAQRGAAEGCKGGQRGLQGLRQQLQHATGLRERGAGVVIGGVGCSVTATVARYVQTRD